MKGWVISTNPGTNPGDTTPWYASFWEFCTRYCNDRFDDQWHLSPEQSLLLYAEHTIVPRQLVIYSPKGTNNTIDLLFGTSLYDLKQAQMLHRRDLVHWQGLPAYSAAAALVKVPAAFFRRHPLEAQIILAAIDDPSDLLGRLLDGGHSAAAGRLAGALRCVGQEDRAQDLVETMKAAGYDIRESNPFDPSQKQGRPGNSLAPIVGRLELLWESLRRPVLKVFPESAEKPVDAGRYLHLVDQIYQSDAYHSLSIEGYLVTPDLIERVRSGDWNPDANESDQRSRDALAARGYWEAFQLVRESVARIIAAENPGEVVRSAHRDWYRALFQPCVRAGLIAPSALAGYRNDAVYIRGSRHVPPRWEVMQDAMPALFDLIEEEPEPAVRAVLGHWLIGYIHPYPDGNGRMARFAMNAMLAAGGYPWTVIRVEDRHEYLATLETASVDLAIEPFARFIAERVDWSSGQNAGRGRSTGG